MALTPAAPEATAAEAAPSPFLELPDSVLVLVSARLPSADKKACRLACRALRSAVSGAVTSLLLTDDNLPLLALPPQLPTAPAVAAAAGVFAETTCSGAVQEAQQHPQQHPQPSGGYCAGGGYSQQGPTSSCTSSAWRQRAPRREPLHSLFPNLTHLCFGLGPSPGPESRRTALLRSLLSASLPRLRGLRCVDLSAACRDVALGRTCAELLATWRVLVEQGLPAGRPVRLLLHPPAALASSATANPAAPGEGAEAAAAAAAAALQPDQLFAAMMAVLGRARPLAEVRLVAAPPGSKRYDKPRIPTAAELVAALSAGAVAEDGSGGIGSSRHRGDAWRCPAITGLVLGPESFDTATLAATAIARSAAAAHAAATAAALAPWLITNPLHQSALQLQQPQAQHHHRYQGQLELQQQQHQQQQAALAPAGPTAAAATANLGAMRRSAQLPAALQPQPAAAYAPSPISGLDPEATGPPWLPLLAAVNAAAAAAAAGGDSGSGSCWDGGAVRELHLWEAWPLAALLPAQLPQPLQPSASQLQPSHCLMGLRRLVLTDQQAVLDRDRLTSATLAPLSVLACLTRLELASLTVQAGPASAAVAAAAAAAAKAAARAGAGGGSGSGIGSGSRGLGKGRGGKGGGAGGADGVAAAAAALLRKHKLAGRKVSAAGVFAPLPQVLHVSVYHALRIEWPPDNDSAAAELAEAMFSGGGSSSSSSSSSRLPVPAGPLAALFPRLRHLSAGVTPGPAGRSGGERWGFLAGAGPCLRSLHLRAATAEDLTLQGRSEVLAALTALTALRLSAEAGKLDGIHGLVRTLRCFHPHSLAALRLSRLSMRLTAGAGAGGGSGCGGGGGSGGGAYATPELHLPRLTRLVFDCGCGGELVGAFDGVALSAARLKRLEVKDSETVRPCDLQWALERQMGLTQLVVRDCPGLAAPGLRHDLAAAVRAAGRWGPQYTAVAHGPAAGTTPASPAAGGKGGSTGSNGVYTACGGLRLSVSTTSAEEERALRRSRHGGADFYGPAPDALGVAAASSFGCLEASFMQTAGVTGESAHAFVESVVGYGPFWSSGNHEWGRQLLAPGLGGGPTADDVDAFWGR
ncbi:hypothetical protein HYH02_012577 [Chlamydomonas schloesseri]|uniref:F-box domain-containing protein n=1 Tax=Chlamydomonas schloesseri TaxID=2026947 RepID=A0A835W1M1_9CHLO|nr:hypothetical protein HYH02_012577 [Chlamydomonas schloesseri]|eukprot:KAG2433649.1 hypothetical protein HYH02_012577 [Chlamydomonas schloesseri]